MLARSFRYEGRGFDKNFLWYAPQRVTTVSTSTTWATCVGARASDGWCNTVDTSQALAGSFAGDTALTVLEYGGAFIGLAGGNWSTGVPLTVPTPVITGSKFHDKDSDGQRDTDEPASPGWTMQLVRQSSTVGQAVGSVRSTGTGDEGSFQFDLYGSDRASTTSRTSTGRAGAHHAVSSERHGRSGDRRGRSSHAGLRRGGVERRRGRRRRHARRPSYSPRGERGDHLHGPVGAGEPRPRERRGRVERCRRDGP